MRRLSLTIRALGRDRSYTLDCGVNSLLVASSSLCREITGNGTTCTVFSLPLLVSPRSDFPPVSLFYSPLVSFCRAMRSHLCLQWQRTRKIVLAASTCIYLCKLHSFRSRFSFVPVNFVAKELWAHSYTLSFQMRFTFHSRSDVNILRRCSKGCYRSAYF